MWQFQNISAENIANMSEDGDHGEMEDVATPSDFFDHIPSKQEKIEMRKANKPPSEWLRLLCKDWAAENEDLVDTADSRFLDYKPFLKGMLSSQLLCRLSTAPSKDGLESASPTQSSVDFWRILGIDDEFDKSYITAQVERFCLLYNIRGVPGLDETPTDTLFGHDLSSSDPATLAAAAAGISVSPGGGIGPLPTFVDQTAAAMAVAAADNISKLSKRQVSEVSRAHRMAKDAAKALEHERRQNMKREQRRMSIERKEQKAREREAIAVRKASERAAREASREDRRRKKLEIRLQREKFAQEQKEAALKRAAELVESNRVPLELVRGPAAVKNNTNISPAAASVPPPLAVEPLPRKKPRSAIVVSTATDLNEIVTHSKNLWAKYNAIAKEHNQKVNWITVAKELGIHVKVREKYARMHARAEQRGFDWEKNGGWKIKDHPEIFLEPTQAEQKAKMPPPTFPDTSRTVLLGEGNKEVTDEAVAAAAAVVDASVNSPPMDAVVQTTEEHAEAAAAVAATLVVDPTAGLVEGTTIDV